MLKPDRQPALHNLRSRPLKKLAIVLAVFLLTGLLLAWANTPLLHAQSAATAMPLPPGQTEDPRALGYVDSRKLVRDSVGNVYVAYRKKANGFYHIFVAKKSGNNPWQELRVDTVDSNLNGYNQRVPSLALSKNGTVEQLHLVWYGASAAIPPQSEDNRNIKYLRMNIANGAFNLNQGAYLYQNLVTVSGFTLATSSQLWQEHPTIYSFADGSYLFVTWEGAYSDTLKTRRIGIVYSADGGDHWKYYDGTLQTPPLTDTSRLFIPSNGTPTDPKTRNINALSRPTLIVSGSPGKNTLRLHVFAYGTPFGYAVDKIQQVNSAPSNGSSFSWGNWGLATATASTTEERHVSVARDDAELIYFVWQQNDKTIQQPKANKIGYRRYDPSTGAYGYGATITANSGNCVGMPSIAVYKSSVATNPNRVFVTWTQGACSGATPLYCGADDDTLQQGNIFYASRPVSPSSSAFSTVVQLTQGGNAVYGSLRRVNKPSTDPFSAFDIIWTQVASNAYTTTCGPTPNTAHQIILNAVTLPAAASFGSQVSPSGATASLPNAAEVVTANNDIPPTDAPWTNLPDVGN